jgi:hypothetical protein
MIISTKLKIWTLITHAFIVIGMGHGIATLGIFEIFSIVSLLSPSSGRNDDSVFYVLLLSSLFALFGQIAMIVSIYAKSEERRKWLNIVGLCLLWISVIISAYAIREDRGSFFATVTCIPFAFCTIRAMLGRHIQRLCRNLWEKMVG